MPIVTLTQPEFLEATNATASQMASAWSEAAKGYGAWITLEQTSRVVSETEKFNRFAAELGKGFRDAAASATAWAQAARDAGRTGIADIMDKYGAKSAEKADRLLNQMMDQKENLNLIAAEARDAMAQGERAFGGGLGKALGPAFDAAAMMKGALDWYTTGSSSAFGGAAMGVVLGAGFGLLAAGAAAFFSLPALGIALFAGVAAGVGSFLGDGAFKMFSDGVNALVEQYFNGARTFVWPSDPLVLDLDGDGIEAIAINPAAPIFFDHDADGVKTATGWIKSDDGIVVMDRNGNGTIDSGRELFGDNTLLEHGPNAGQLAANGFAALADLDLNGDSKIDASDATYSQLRIWQDLNQDGISQAGELSTLAAKGISSISVAATATNTNLGNGNTQPWTGSFVRTNGSTGVSGTAELAGSLLLTSNNFYRQFTDDPQLTVEAKRLPQMRGSGTVRDLREAMSLSTSAATTLKEKVSGFAQATTRDAQLAAVDDLIAAWGQTSGHMAHNLFKYSLYQGAGGVLNTADDSFATNSNVELTWHPQGLEQTTNQAVIGPVTTPTAAGYEVLRRLNVLEVFNGTKFLNITLPPAPAPTGSTTGSGGGTGVVAGPPQVSATLSDTQINLINLINQSYAALQESVYSALVVQTRLRSYLDSIELVVDNTGVHFNAAPMAAALDARKTSDARNGLIDLIDLNRYAQPALQAVGFAGVATLRSWVDALPPTSPLRSELPALGVILASATGGTDTADVYLGDSLANTFSGGGGNDTIDGGAGNDNLQGGAGDDVIDGGAGNDVLAGDFVSTFHGWYGGAGNDTYLFGRGDGQDMVYDLDTTTNNFDRIVFKAGVAPTDVQVVRANDDLVLKIAGTTDQIQVSNYFAGDGAAGWAIEQINFTGAPAMTWTGNQCPKLALSCLSRIWKIPKTSRLKTRQWQATQKRWTGSGKQPGDISVHALWHGAQDSRPGAATR